MLPQHGTCVVVIIRLECKVLCVIGVQWDHCSHVIVWITSMMVVFVLLRDHVPKEKNQCVH